MPASTYQIPGGSRVMIFTCEECGAPASFGVDAHLRDAIRTGDVRRAGRWYCGWNGTAPVCKRQAKGQAA